MTDRPERWIVDLDDPRAPPQELWDRMTEAERERIVESLPSECELEALVRRAEERLTRLRGDERQAELGARRAGEAARRADQAEARLREALAEIERLKRAGA